MTTENEYYAIVDQNNNMAVLESGLKYAFNTREVAQRALAKEAKKFVWKSNDKTDVIAEYSDEAFRAGFSHGPVGTRIFKSKPDNLYITLVDGELFVDEELYIVACKLFNVNIIPLNTIL